MYLGWQRWPSPRSPARDPSARSVGLATGPQFIQPISGRTGQGFPMRLCVVCHILVACLRWQPILIVATCGVVKWAFIELARAGHSLRIVYCRYYSCRMRYNFIKRFHGLCYPSWAGLPFFVCRHFTAHWLCIQSREWVHSPWWCAFTPSFQLVFAASLARLFFVWFH